MTSTTTEPGNYVEAHLPPAIIKRLESGAFKSLCEHLRERSDEVPNIDLMTVSGFCRNCLSKWLVVEARKLSDSIRKKAGNESEGENPGDVDEVVRALDAMGYDEAAQYVYGMMYPEWKKRHAQKASDEQMEKFNNSKPLWAKHDKQVLAKRSEEAPILATTNDPNAACKINSKDGRSESAATSTATSTTTKPSLLSNVCCEDVDNIDNTKTANSEAEQNIPPEKNSPSTSFVPPVLPSIAFSLGVVTVSDRAYAGKYESGDLSGPAVTGVVASILENGNTNTRTDRVETTIVPDEVDAIQTALTNWSSPSSSEPALDLIITTGGTGFSPRDVTPEATAAVLERPCDGLMAFCSMVLQTVQPLAALSRGTAGVRGDTLIVNLPGNPAAVHEILPILLPLALQAVADMTQRE
eukprot:CAMPEP_0197186314 /NCGR_PEP_ID=MMETSP1423-20130617/13686_1 /TAXON_ID=476441 /ORGANISM="Pseudo-nitzschia heimii, Strain UNC1101" /LENGTH=410 /DNA_ID=CAMNT_0042637589 /DNA_START=26 /DNA_END=1258 /DNA_ORIENTATION=+